MVTYDEARETMLACMEDKGWFNFCTECEGAFVFSKYDDYSIGGVSPCAVLKRDGGAYLFDAVLDELGETLHTYVMGEDGSLDEIPTNMYWDMMAKDGPGWITEEKE